MATKRLLKLEPEQTVRTIAHTRMQVFDGLRADSLEIDCSAVREMDASFLHLLLSTRRQAVERRHTLRFRILPRTVVETALARAGLDAQALSVGGAA